MNDLNCSLVPDCPLDDGMVTIPGSDSGTALRVQVAHPPDGDVRLEQLAYAPTLGWYVQKSFCIPGCMLGDLIRQLRKADCLMPRPPTRKHERLCRPDALLPFPGLGAASKTA